MLTEINRAVADNGKTVLIEILQSCERDIATYFRQFVLHIAEILFAYFREFLQRYCRDITEPWEKDFSQFLQRYCRDIAYKFQTNLAETV